MTKRTVGAKARMSGVASVVARRRSRGSLLLSTALGCSLLVVAAAGQAKAQQVQQSAVGDISYTQTEPMNSSPFAVDLTSETGNVTVDVGQVNVTNNGTGSGYAVSAVTFAPDKLISIAVDEVTATGTGRIFGVVAQAGGGSNIQVNAGAIEASGNGGYGIWGATSSGSITIDAGTITTSGGIHNAGTENARNSHGVWAQSESGDISVTSDSITTSGFGSAGVHAVTAFGGDVVIDSGVISTTNSLAPGILAEGHNVTVHSDTITTVGDAAPGIYVPEATGDVTITSNKITTSGTYMTVGEDTYISAGIAVEDGENVLINSTEINTSGGGGFGIAVDGVATATVNSGTVATTGNAAKGITVEAVTGAINISSESVTTTGGAVAFEGEIIAAEAIVASGDGPITVDSDFVSTEGDFAHGILVQGNVGDVSITSGQLSTSGDSAQGIFAGTTSGDITIAAGTTTTSGNLIVDQVANPDQWYPDAITAITGSGNISITSQSASADGAHSSAIVGISYGGGDIFIDSGNATGAGDGGVVVYASATGAPDGNVTILSDSITSSGDGAGALTAEASGDVTIESGSIVSTGGIFDGFGPTAIWADSYGGDVVVTSGTITTVGDRAVGIMANADVGSVSVTSDHIATRSARGIMVSAAGDITIDSNSVHSVVPEGGSGAHAIMVTAGAGAVNITSDDIVTEGPSSHGIYVANADGEDIAGVGTQRAATGGTGLLTINSGAIESSGWGMMIDHQGAIDITSGQVTSGQHGVYLYGGDAITLNSTSVETTNGAGIVLRGDDGAINITSGHVLVGTGGDIGVFGQTSTGDITIHAGDTTTTATGLVFGFTADAVGAISNTGDVTIVSGSTSTVGYGATGVFAFTDGAISVTSDSVTTAGDSGNGIFVGGNGAITVDSGEIHTSGDENEGAIIVTGGEGDITVDSDLIEATGANSHGIVVTFDGQGPTYGNHPASGGTGLLTVNSGAIDVTGVGLFVDHVGDMSITSGTISSDGPGVYIYGGGAVDLTSESVDSTYGPAIVVWGEEGPVTIDSGYARAGETGDVGVFVITGAGDISITADETITTNTGMVGDITADAVGAISDTGDIVIVSGSASAAGLYSSGIAASTAGDISVTSGSVTNTGVNGNGIFLGGNNVTLVSESVTTSGDGAAFGVRVNAAGDVVVESGSISTTGAMTSGGRPYGLQVGSSGGSIDVISGSISTEADRAYGLAVNGSGEGTYVNIDSGSVTTAGAGARAVYGFHTGGGDVTIVSDEVVTTGGLFDGALASEGIRGHSSGAVGITSGSVSTAGDRAYGVVVSGGSSSVTVDSGSATTTGAAAQAIRVTQATGDIAITSGEITTTGADAHGIYVAEAEADFIEGIGEWRLATGATGLLTIDSGSMDVSGWGMMIDHAGDIDITSGDIVAADSGIYLYGGGAITIDSGSIDSGGPGIIAWGDEGAVDITSDSVVVGPEGDIGVFAQTTSGDIVIHAGATTTTNPGLAYGSYTADAVGALSDTGDITIVSGTATTEGLYSSGVWASTGGNVSITSTAIVNTGELGNGILGFADGSVTIDSGSINASGDGSWGLYVEAGGDATVTSDAIVNTGALHEEGHSLGLYVAAGGDANVDSGSISTTGAGAFGIGVLATGDVTLVSDSVTTTGADAFGIGVIDAANATLTVGDVSVSGEGQEAAGVVVTSTGVVDVTVTGDVSSAHSFGLALEAGAASAYDIVVANGATVFGGLGAIGLNSDADATLTIGGHLDSDVAETVLLAGGDDVVNLVTGANIEGGLYGGAGFDTLNLNSTVNSGVGIGQSVDDVVDFEAITVSNGHWTVGGGLVTETTLTGGTLVITGSLTDDVTIGQLATLQIGNGGATGELIGDLVVAGTAIFNRSNEYDFGGDISGAGTLVKEGAEKLILSGAYNFTGTTVVNGGVIKIIHLPETAEIVVDEGVLDLTGADQELASLSGGEQGTVDIDEGSLTVNQEGTTEFAGEITGDGALTLTGGGTLNLTGDNTYTGPTTVDEGTLKVNGSVTSDVTVDDGGVLGGSGEIEGDVLVDEGGIVGPGNSPGVLTVVGDFTFAAGSTYEAEVEADGDHDQIDVSGQTTIENNVTLAVLAGNGDYARLSNYTILTSDGGVTGTFDNITTNLAFLDPHLTYNATSVVLSLTRNDVSFASFADNANQEGVADVIEAAGFGNPLYDALVVQSAADSQAAYVGLSGELYASLPTVLLHQSRYGREAVMERAAHAPEGRGVWGELIGSSLEFGETTDSARVESEGRGLVVGADTELNGLRFGAAVTHIASDVESTTLRSEADVKSTTLAGYASGQMGAFRATVGGSFSRHDVDAQRIVTFPDFADATTADYEGTSGEVFAEVAMSHNVGGVFLEPFVGIGFHALDLDGFTEEGGDAALAVDSVSRNVSTATVGVRVSGSYETSIGRVTPYAKVALQQVYGDDEATATAAFATTGAFGLTGQKADDGVAGDIGVRIDRGNLGFNASYSGVGADEWDDQQVKVGVSFRF